MLFKRKTAQAVIMVAMQKLITAIIGKKVFSVHDGVAVAEVVGWLINKDNFKVELIVVAVPEMKAHKYILPAAIRVSTDRQIIINSQDDIAEADELVRQREMIASKYRLVGSKVETQSGKKLGRVMDFNFDYNTFYIAKIHVVSRFPQRITRESFAINRSAVVEVQGNTVIVKDARVRAKARRVGAKTLPALPA